MSDQRDPRGFKRLCFTEANRMAVGRINGTRGIVTVERW